jgi:hypothetical protein
MNKVTKKTNCPPFTNAKVAIIGAGIAGSTIALRFAELGIDVTLIEKGASLVNGPPICHLHAGGNLYREISDEQCLTLLQQSIDTVKVYPQSVSTRPTVVALPLLDAGSPEDLLPRLITLRDQYADLVEQDASNEVLGNPKNYFRLFERKEIEEIAQRALPKVARCDEDWLVAFAKQVDLNKLKFPLVLVQEYGLSAFRFAAIACLAIDKLPTCHLHTNSRVVDISAQSNGAGWQVSVQHHKNERIDVVNYDYVINACGFKSGELDDMLNVKRQRMVEFKAAYVAHWPQCQGFWPEVVFYGERGTPQGMAQLTPYPNGYFQLHGMTQAITLFEDGLVASSEQSAQPKLPSRFIDKIDHQWPDQLIKERTLGNIEHVAQFIPGFSAAKTAANPMFGAQQIPGDDPDLRAADVSFHQQGYARTEIVKASSALAAADAILKDLLDSGVVSTELAKRYACEHYFPVSQQCQPDEVTKKAEELACERNYPAALAQVF